MKFAVLLVVTQLLSCPTICSVALRRTGAHLLVPEVRRNFRAPQQAVHPLHLCLLLRLRRRRHLLALAAAPVLRRSIACIPCNPERLGKAVRRAQPTHHRPHGNAPCTPCGLSGQQSHGDELAFQPVCSTRLLLVVSFSCCPDWQRYNAVSQHVLAHV